MHTSNGRLRRPAAAARMAAVVVAAAGMLAGVGQTPRVNQTPRVDAAANRLSSFNYDCRFPSGEQPAAVRVTATVPVSVSTTTPVEPTGVRVTVTVPRAAAGYLADLHAATVAATEDLSVTVSENGAATQTAWAGLKAPRAAVPASEPLALTATGPASPVIAQAPGSMAFTAGELVLALAPRTAAGAATSPAAIRVTCTPGPGQPLLLGSVRVDNTAAASSGKAAGSAAATHGVIAAGSPATGSGAAPPAVPPIDVQGYRTCHTFPDYPVGHGSGYGPGSIYASSYADVEKAGGAAVVGYPTPALVASQGPNEFFSVASPPATGTYQCQYFAGEVDYPQRAFPPARATFLGFGFMPVTATATITQVGKAPVTAVVSFPAGSSLTTFSNCTPCQTVSTAEVSLSISNVAVNGVPLDVGSNCHTIGPIYTPVLPKELGLDPDTLVLTGGSGELGYPLPWSGTHGGALAGTATIPPFTGCRTPGGENLDPLITASVSGPGNYVKALTGDFCDPESLTNNGYPCTSLGVDQPVTVPWWTVTHGSTYTGTTSGAGALTFTWNGGYSTSKASGTIVCPNTTITGKFLDSAGVERTYQGTETGMSATDCQGTFYSAVSGTTHSTWTVEQQGTAYFDSQFYDATSGTTYADLDGFSMQLSENQGGPDYPCDVDLTGYGPGLTDALPVAYTNPPNSTLSFDTSSPVTTNGYAPNEPVPPQPANNECPRAIYNKVSQFAEAVGFGFSYQISPRTITITSPQPPR
jgi:hypothetical protein